VTGSCEHGVDHSDSMKRVKVLGRRREYVLISNESAPLS
jgi:hypothetical protein